MPAPVRLDVDAPHDVRLGDVFQARVRIEANGPVRDLSFSVTYEKSRLRLVGHSQGDFARQPGVASEFGMDEPSDGNIEVSFNAVNGSTATGAGALVVLDFEPIGAGSSGIEIADLKSVDAAGEANSNVVVANAHVTVHRSYEQR